LHPPRGLQAHLLAQEYVHVQGQVRTVLLGGAHREKDHGLPLDSIVHLFPGQVIESIWFPRHALLLAGGLFSLRTRFAIMPPMTSRRKDGPRMAVVGVCTLRQ